MVTRRKKQEADKVTVASLSTRPANGRATTSRAPSTAARGRSAPCASIHWSTRFGRIRF